MGDTLQALEKKDAPRAGSADKAGTRVPNSSSIPTPPDVVKPCLRVALALAALGFRVHPVHHPDDAEKDEDPTKKGKTPRLPGWPDLATTDPEIIDGWLREWPNTNMGVRTGVNLAVVDVDGPEGQASIKGRAMPPTLTVRTGRGDGGLHYWFKMPEGKNYRNRVGLLPGIDIRGEGGQAVVPPSLHGSGQRYKWADYMSPDEVDLAPCPDWLCDMLDLAERFTGDTTQAPAKTTDTTTPYGKGAIRNISAEMVAATKGTRNNTLFICAASMGNLVGGGEIAEADARAALEQAALENGVMDDEPAETAATITSGLSKGKLEPRCAPEQAADTKTTQAEILYDLAQKAVFFRDSGVTRYATVPAGDTYELCERGGGFRDWLLRMYRAEHHRSPSTTALQQAMNSIVAEAAVAPIYTVGLRVATTDDALWLDLANDVCEVAKVTASGWTITAELPDGLRFRRPRGQVALPTPTHNGDGFGLLRKLLSNATDDDFIMIVAWLMAALRPNVPAPVLVLTGEQGSAKTTTAKILRYLIDPVGADGTDLTRPPNNDRDIFAIVNSLHVLAIDNVSRITKFVSDTLSSISTGGSLQKRELYKDEGMVNISARRPIIINGIGGGAADIASRPDLLDRAISVTLQSIEDTERKTEADIWRDVRDAAPAILGALLSGMSEALLRMPTTKLDRLPRMADFALWIVSAENLLPWDAGQFMQIYAANRDEATANMLEDNLIFPYIATLAAGDGGWTGTFVELHSALQQMASDQSKRADDWPDTTRKVAKHMKRIEPAMRQAGYEIQRDRTKAARLITVKKVTEGD